MNNNRTIQQKDMQKLFPAWEKNIPTLGTKYSQPGNKTGLRFAISLLLMFVLGINTAWGQETDYSGVYYLGNSNGYNAENVPNNFYLLPATNADYATGQPHLTTYKANHADNSCWYVIKNGTYYNIIHAEDGKYLAANPAYDGTSGNDVGRLRVHLEAMDTPDNSTLFDIKPNKSGGYNIRHKDMADKINNSTTTYLDPAGGNIEGTDLTNYRKMSTSSGDVNVGGGIGYWTDEPAARWYFEKALSIDPPTITNNFDGTITITADGGAAIYYTTDGSTPTMSSSVYSTAITLTEDITVIKAIAKATSDPFPTLVTTYDLPVCERPVISVSGGNVSITCPTADASIYYKTDGSDPTNGTQYSSAFPVSDGMIIKAIAKKSGLSNSDIASLIIVLNPTITIDGGPFTYNGTQQQPAVTVKKGDDVINPTEYQVSYGNNIDVGNSATVTITDNEDGEYYVAGSATFTISPMSIGSGNDPVDGITIDVMENGESHSVTVKHNGNTLTQDTDYTWTGNTVGDDYEVTVTGMGNYTGSAKAQYIPVTPGYYVLHQNGKGYLKVSGAGVNLGNDGTFQSGNLFDKGNCIWYMTPEGYLQNEYFYLNAANNKTLYLSVNPVTRWRSEDVTGENTYGKKHLKINDGTNDLYLCNNGSSITLQAGPSAYYSACPVTVEEVENSWAGPTAENLTVQSPQLVTYLRAYFTQKIKYTFHNDAGAEVKSTDGKHERRVYATIAYKEGGNNKGTDWDIDESGILYNKKASGDVEFTATYNILPADPVVRAAHSTPATKDIKYKVTQKPLAITADTDYLLYSISGGNNNRYPYDDGIADGGAVKPDGINTVLTDPENNKNLQISWKITVDAEGFYTFQNSNTNKYLYYDDTPHASSDYGTLSLSANLSGNSAKFRLYKTSDTNYSTCYYIIPYSKLFAVYKSDGLASGLDVALNVKDYTNEETKVISLFKPNGNSTWCIYKYVAEYRIRSDFSISGPNTASETGNYEFTSEGWYGKYITESPKTGSGQNGLVINGTYKDANNIDYLWTVTGLGNNITIADGTNTDGTWTKTTRGNTNNRKLVVNVPSLPTSSTSGVIKLKLSGCSAPSENVKTSSEKTFAFTIFGDGTVSFTEITSLSQITSSSGVYRLVGGESSNFAYSVSNKPGVTTFSGILDGNNQTISDLSAPLFDNLTNGTVHNVNLSGVSISNHSGATGAIAGTADGGSRIYNVGVLGGEVGSSDDVCGGLVGKLDGSARVINCFSYATITGGTTVGGIVGNNTYASKSNDMRTMVMNCMFYGDITGGTSKAPIYNGQIITNRSDQNGVNNFNYFWAGASYVIDAYNCALAAETRFLNRFEFYRHLLNSNRALAAWWATGDYNNKDKMMKWVMEPSQIGSVTTPYPILKDPDRYPSVVNIDVNHSETYKGQDLTVGTKLGTLTVNIQMGSNGDGDTHPVGAEIIEAKKQLALHVFDKDPTHFNFNYYKVQLPYYNDVGTNNYRKDAGGVSRVVTGWKIVTISGGTTDYSTDNDNNATTPADAEAEVDANGDITLTTPYNFADRHCTDKDKYSESGRVFSQGAYFDVPEGVTSITIEPYWAKCVYVADAYPDVVYNQDMSAASNVTTVGTINKKAHYTNGESYSINGESQVVYTSMSNAAGQMPTSGNVYDNAIVLVGNVHSLDLSNNTDSKEYTIMSIDLDKDNEPDYSYILRFNDRKRVHPVRVDFLNVIGLGMAQKSTGGQGTYNLGIMQPLGWFECTNTGLFRVTQFEYDRNPRKSAPMILHGGVIEQWVTVAETSGNVTAANAVDYYHVGSNVWFKEFHIGAHQDRQQVVSSHPPISVTGGDFDIFYLTGMYNTPNTNYNDNAECYINGGRFGKVAGTGMQGIGGFTMNGTTKTNYSNGNIIWQIDNADIDEFYAGGINAAHIAEGNIWTVIRNSRVDQFCGGPKFGNMNSDKKVVTNATNCTFRTFFGAGYGGNSYNREYPTNKYNDYNYGWNTWLKNVYKKEYKDPFKGVSTRIDYQFIPKSDNTLNVGRLFVDYISFSLATTHDVTSKLTDCTITTSPLGRLSISDDYQCLGSFYGGGSLGMVDGPVKSTLTNCTVEGNVFGGGYSATLPTVQVMNDSFQREPSYDTNTGAYTEAILPTTESYTWEQVTEAEFNTKKIDTGNHILYTTETLTGLGAVTGNVTLTIDGNTTLTNGKMMSVAHSVYGGGEESNVEGNTSVNITGGTITENVFGGGKGEADEFSCSKAMVGVNNAGAGADLTTEENKNKGTKVTISNGTVNGNVYGGGEVGRVEWNTQVTIGAVSGGGTPIVNGSVFGAGAGVATHGYAALVRGNSSVTIQGNAKVIENVYGGGEQATVGRYWVKGINNVDSEGNPIPSAPSAPTDMPDEMPYKTMSGGQCTVTVQGSAQIGPDDGATATAGHVFGAGKGVTPNYVHTGEKANWSRRMVDYNSTKHADGEKGTTWDYCEDYTEDQIADTNFPKYVWEYFATEDKYFEFLQTLALVTGTDVTIGGGTVKGNVYGGSESGFVQDDTDVKVTSGTIGTSGTTTNGNVFGGGKGLSAFAEAGKVKGNTGITISGGTTNGNVYGGGELGDVGTIDKTDINNYTWSDYSDEDTTNDTGKCLVSVTNAAATIKGDVFGAGKGSGVTFQCEKAMAYNTEVTISAGTVNGNVYGGGEVGRVENNTKVKIGDGAGVAEGDPTSAPNITLSVFGAGKGLATHGYSALVRGNTEVTIEGNAKVGKSVYGGGEIASVGRYGLNSEKMPNILLDGGRCIVTVQGYAVVGPENATDDKGNVFGAGRGVDTPYDGTNQRMTLDNENNSVYQDIGSEEAYKSYLETLALATHPEVTIGGHATINGFVFGGGELGLTKGSVVVNINGGTIEKDVYGGGALANTNTTHEVGVKENGVWKKENGEYVTTTVHPTTKVNLLGGLIKRDAFGGGLGQLGDSPIAAIVDGDVTVELNNNNGTCQVNGSVFGSNNINGTPKGHVKVHVFKTVKAGNTKDPENKTTLNQRWSENATYDLAAVYGGGNKADYKPTSVTDYAEVIIDGCDETSIKEVYGGGYGAAVPATQVKILGAYLINEVFGGGYGAGDNNDGANVGYYTYKNEEDKTVYTGFTDNDGNGKAQVKLYGGKVYTAYGGSNTKGNIRGGSSASKATDIPVTCSLEVKNIYGAGKNADQDGGTDLVIGCIPGLENVYGGAKDANIKGGVNLVITGGDFVNVFGGNDTSGTIQGPIKVYIEEDCDAINITNLYLGGNQAPYSVYGYYDDNGTLKPRTSATDTNPVAEGTIAPDATTHQYEDPQLYVTKFTSIENVYGGGYGSGAVMYGNPTVNINEVKKKFTDGIGEIENVYGGGDAAKVEGNTTVNVGTIDYALLKYITVGETDVTGYYTRSGAGTTEDPYVYTVVTPEAPATEVSAQANTDYYMPVLGAKITGNVYGGGNLADVTGNTYVNICAKKDGNDYVAVPVGTAGVSIGGNVYGGGKGKADTFTCEKAMIGEDGKGLNANYTDGNTSVIIGNGTVGTLDENGKLVEGTGNIYGGGQIGRVERNTTVTIGLGNGIATGTPESAPEIKGKVFGAGAGEEEHGYAALVRGNPTVTIQGNAKIGQSVYGGGEIASVARYKVAETQEEATAHGVDVDMPYVLENNDYGHCVVTIKGYAEIGPNDMKMYHENVAVGNDKPDDYGHVFGAGKGVLPKVYVSYGKNSNGPKRMILYNINVHTNSNPNWEWVDPDDTENNKNIWEYFASEEKYFEFIHTLALATETEVTIDGAAFVKGSVYGGSENGLVQFDTKVYIKDGQIGNGDGVNRRYSESDWSSESLAECAHWDYGKDTNQDGKKDLFAPYDPNANAEGDLDKYPKVDAQSEAKSTEGGRRIATDGHTYYGNVFGGGSGSVPYFDTQKGISRYISTAGEVRGDTYVTISGGHILTNVYGGNEATNVLGTAHVTMTGGTVGVPRTAEQIKDHPVTCYLFGAGKGDQRIFFNKETNVNDAIVKVEGGTIYGSVFGGGEDGHVLRNTSVTIGKTDGTGPKIGTVGSTYVDGNVFGGGRGFGGEALTAGNVGGAVDLIINGGEMLGSIYGGGRLASVGYGLYLTTEDGYGVMRPDNVDDKGNSVANFKRGYITVTVNGGTIGKEFADDTEGEHSGNVFGGSMGRLTKLDGTPFDAADHWKLLATAKSTTVNINGGTIKRSVYGGGEMGTVTTDAIVNVSGGSIGTSGKGGAEFGNVYGGGKGYVDPNGSNYVAAGIIKGNTTVAVSGTPQILHNVYGGGAYGSVGTFTDFDAKGFPTALTAETGTANVTITGGTIGSTGKDNGMVFGSSRGLEGNPETDANVDKIAWVGNTIVTIGTQNSETGPSIKGSVYGGGENGHNFQDASVTVHSGTIGIPEGEDIVDNGGTPGDTSDDITYSGARFPNRGNVYGSGCGTDTYTGTDSKTYFDFNAGIVRGNTTVLIDGGHVVHNVYGGGAMGSVGTYTFADADYHTAHPEVPVGKPISCADGTGTCTVTVSGGQIGVAGAKMAGYGKGGPDDFGHVFGAGRGEMHDPDQYPNVETCAYFNKTILNISGTAFLTGSAYGGSESGHVLGDTEVNISGGQIGCGKNATARYEDNVWENNNPTEDLECASWPFEAPFAPYDPFANAKAEDDLDKYPNGDSTEGGRLEASDGHTYYGNVFGGGSGSVPYFDTTAGISKYLSTAGTVEGNTKVTISGGHILTNVYGGCEATNVKGSATIKMTGGTVGVPRIDAQIIAHPLTGYVFGAGKGDQRIFFNKETNVNHSIVTVEGGRIYGSVYGGGEDGHVLGNVTMTIGKTGNTGPTIGTRGTSYYDGHVFGGGRGFGGEALTAGNVGGAVTLDILGGQILGSVYGGGRLASVGYGLYLTTEDGYGQMRADDQYDGSYPDPSPEAASTFYDKGRGKIYLTVSGGTIGNNVVNDKYGGNVYGGSMGRSTKLDGSPFDANHWTLLATVKQTTLTITEGIVKRNVYGGGELGAVKGAVLVNVNGGTIEKDVYGGGALANTNTWAEGNSSSYTTTVNLLDGLVKGDAYGGGLGQKKEFNGAISDIEATVYGDVTVNLGDEGATKATAFNISYDETDDKDENNNLIQVVKSGRVFGCNNLNGSPQGDVTVNVYKTVKGNVQRTEAEDPEAEEQRAKRDASEHTYELAAVYGGGNLADYTATGKKASVVIHSCDVSVQYVYGGGNAAAVPETDVLVKGAWEIDHVFGGGNGKDKYKKGNAWIANAGANVNGNTNTLLTGGYIHEAYGGSNEKGTITGNVTINTDADPDCACALDLVKLYGAGKNADIEGDLIVVLECAPETKTEEIYGGAENANVKGNVELTITSGTFGKVFGGNNQSGAIFGHIILNIEETGCRPINIDELYGCGNNAAYSVYGYKNGGTDYEGYPIYVPRTSKDDGTPVTFAELPHTVLNNTKPQYNDPELNIISCTSIGKVFGGGLGAGATVYGNPTVNINQIKGDWAGKTIGTGESAITIPNQLGEIGCGYINENSVRVEGGVFGGGNEANVVGNTNVNIGTEAEVYVVKFVDVGASVKDYYTRNNDGTYTATAATETAKADTYYYKKETVLGANIKGNVYGGGNNAEVTGNTNVNIGKKSE